MCRETSRADDAEAEKADEAFSPKRQVRPCTASARREEPSAGVEGGGTEPLETQVDDAEAGSDDDEASNPPVDFEGVQRVLRRRPGHNASKNDVCKAY